MKGFFVAAVLCSLPLLSQAEDRTPLHGTVRFTGAVVTGLCNVTTYSQGRVWESCAQDATFSTLTVQAAASTPPLHISIQPLPQPSTKMDQEYVLINATGSAVKQGRYVITQKVL
ncbi:hypothetical protein [Pseudomonas sp. RW10S2]|uniref:hypothetical protein n=1 Tax=Pseudomonas sp. RW10S2 TaxID=459637 RepID=UPI001644B796|nr:hypothetical protein [Pseudomonas sp. RW10S2]MBC3466462.1 hypothetical protein [Pseudomonas sp. RW10S2]